MFKTNLKQINKLLAAKWHSGEKSWATTAIEMMSVKLSLSVGIY